MKKLIPIVLLFWAAPSFGQSTFLELGLHWPDPVTGLPSYSTPGVPNVTAVLTNSKGDVLATKLNSGFPTVTLPLGLDIYTVHVTAPAANGHPAIDWTFSLPVATQLPFGNGTLTVTSYTCAVALDATGLHGKLRPMFEGTF